jgi:leader peptidase (prepilin peptidase) / N-methyltransferase
VQRIGLSRRTFFGGAGKVLRTCTGASNRVTPSAGKLGFSAVTASAIACLYLAMALPLAVTATVMPPIVSLVTLALGACLVALSAIDYETLRLPDVLTLPLAAAGLLLGPLLTLEPSFAWRVCAAVAGFGFIWALNEGYRGLRGRAGMGLGDAKLLAVAGAWLGLDGLPSTLLYACIAALLFVALRYLRGHSVTRDEPMPFGPFLAAAIWLVWLYGPLV